MVLLWLVGRWDSDAEFKFRNRNNKQIRFSNLLTKLSRSDPTGGLKLLDDRLSRCSLNRSACEDLKGKVLGLLDVEPARIPDGPLGKLTSEQRLAWLLNDRNDMAFNIVKRVFSLQAPVEAAVIGNAGRAKRTVFQLQSGFTERLGGEVFDSRLTLRQTLQQHGLLQPESTMPVVAVQVWRPMAFLINRGMWSDLSLPNKLYCSVVSPEASQSVRCLLEAQGMEWGRQSASSQVSLHPTNFREWADIIRNWADSMAGNSRMDPEGASEVRLSMELLVSTMEGQADALEAVRSGMFDCKRWGFHRYDMVFLIRCLFSCSNLRSDRALRDALVSSLHVLFQGSPGGEANYFMEILGDNDFPVPSPSTLGHMRFVLDCVAMLQKRKYHESIFATGQPEPALFFLLDSSPQGNVNWLMIEYFLVEGNKLQGLCADAWRLHKLGRVRWQDDPDEERVAEERGLVERLTSVLQHHVLPPVGLGSGRSSLQYEHHAFLHALFLETGNFELMCAMGSQTTAIASDKGTEAGIQQAPAVSLRDFLCFAQGDSFMADDGDGQNEAETCMLDFSFSLGIHALQHFVNNCTKGIADAMPSFWEDVYPNMNALISCLSAKFFRQRFAATCLSSSEGAAWRSKFEEGYSDTLVGWRFGSLAACNRALLAYEYPLRRFWDDEKLHFKQHAPQQPGQQPPPRPHSEKPEGPNISVASQACKSKCFWAWQHMFSRIANIVDHMMNWLQSCPCHDLSAGSWGARCHEFAQRLFLERESRPAHCPMSGFRASEIACGQFESFITAITDMELAEV